MRTVWSVVVDAFEVSLFACVAGTETVTLSVVALAGINRGEYACCGRRVGGEQSGHEHHASNSDIVDCTIGSGEDDVTSTSKQARIEHLHLQLPNVDPSRPGFPIRNTKRG